MKTSSLTKYIFIIFLISFVLYFPSLFTFYTNDDFFLLKISQAHSFNDFVNFFNLTQGPDGLGMYRPLTTQVFYFLAWKIFNLNPLGLHLISFGVFFAVIYLVYLLTKNIFLIRNSKFANQAASLAAFLYATSATHFGHLYYLATFQELGMSLFFLLSIIFFIKFLAKSQTKYFGLSFMLFALSLLSKETAVVLPFTLVIIWGFYKFSKAKIVSLNKFVLSLTPYFLFLVAYFYMRIFHYGFAGGDSYIWDFSIKRAINTLGWYGLWSFNLPEMLVDFVGPGLKFNPNLFKFWSKEIIPIFVLFVTSLVLLIYQIVRSRLLTLKSGFTVSNSVFLFSGVWFIITLIPVVFLPLHKFTFYLTLPLMGVVVIISYVLSIHKSLILTPLFMGIWITLSVLTLNLARETHWITRGAETARRLHSYFLQNKEELSKFSDISFYDTPEDKDLPWSPTEILKVTLSDQNYFKVFWGDNWEVRYHNNQEEMNEKSILARRFLGY